METFVKSPVQQASAIFDEFMAYVYRSCLECYDFLCQKDVNGMAGSRRF